MGEVEVFKEMIPLSSEDCFLVKQRTKSDFKFPLHVHMEFELNYLENVKGALRIVGDSIEEMDDLDLVLIAGGVRHAYSNHKCHCDHIFQVTIQFHRSLFDSLLDKRLFRSIKEMFAKANSGLVFSRSMIVDVQQKIKSLSIENAKNPDSFRNLLCLIDLLKTLSTDESARTLNTTMDFVEENNPHQEEDRLNFIMNYLRENYSNQITLSELANQTNMSESSLVRFFKKWTGKTFIETLNEIRIGAVVCRLVDTSDTISEICYKCGFNNLSNFNRIFKKMQHTTPSEYRENFSQSRFKL